MREGCQFLQIPYPSPFSHPNCHQPAPSSICQALTLPKSLFSHPPYQTPHSSCSPTTTHILYCFQALSSLPLAHLNIHTQAHIHVLHTCIYPYIYAYTNSPSKNVHIYIQITYTCIYVHASMETYMHPSIHREIYT